jgi:uncharacterized protein
MWDRLQLVRIYTKPRGSPPDYTAPVVLRKGRCTVEDFAMAIHKEILKQMKYAIVWGSVELPLLSVPSPLGSLWLT